MIRNAAMAKSASTHVRNGSSKNSSMPATAPTTCNAKRVVWTRLISSQMAERRDHLLVDLALERHDQLRQFGHRLPRPLIELGGMAAGRRIDLDLALVAVEAEGEPFLR